jgi:hypothetical protein
MSLVIEGEHLHRLCLMCNPIGYCYLCIYSIKYLNWIDFSYIVAVSFIDGGNWRKATSQRQTFIIILYQVHIAWVGFKLTPVVIGTDYIDRCPPTPEPYITCNTKISFFLFSFSFYMKIKLGSDYLFFASFKSINCLL